MSFAKMLLHSERLDTSTDVQYYTHFYVETSKVCKFFKHTQFHTVSGAQDPHTTCITFDHGNWINFTG